MTSKETGSLSSFRPLFSISRNSDCNTITVRARRGVSLISCFSSLITSANLSLSAKLLLGNWHLTQLLKMTASLCSAKLARLHCYQVAAAPRSRCLGVLLWESIAWHGSTVIRRKYRDDLDFWKQEKELFLKDLPQHEGLFEGLELNDDSDEEDNEEG